MQVAVPATGTSKIMEDLEKEGYSVPEKTLRDCVYSNGVRGSVMIGIPTFASAILLLYCIISNQQTTKQKNRGEFEKHADENY